MRRRFTAGLILAATLPLLAEGPQEAKKEAPAASQESPAIATPGDPTVRTISAAPEKKDQSPIAEAAKAANAARAGVTSKAKIDATTLARTAYGDKSTTIAAPADDKKRALVNRPQPKEKVTVPSDLMTGVTVLPTPAEATAATPKQH